MKTTKILIYGILLIMCLDLTYSESQYCKDIYCNEFDYICCCSYETDNDQWVVPKLQDYNPITEVRPVICPTGIDVEGCYVRLQINHDGEYYTGNNQESCVEQPYCTGLLCGITKDWSRWKCDSEEKIKVTVGSNPTVDLKPGYMVYTWSSDNIAITSGYTKKYELRRTGRAGSCQGIKIQDSVGCTFNPLGSDYRVYNEEKRLEITSKFNLNENDCYRVTTPADKRKCGSTCDNCESDVDCAKNYPKQVSYSGRSLGGYCSNGEITLYGCESTGVQVCLQFDDLNKNNQQDSNEECYDTTEKKSCEVVKRITTGIECCTSDDCRGVGDFYCEWTSDTSSKCVLTPKCQKDLDCGTATKCDIGRKSIIEPYCDSQKQCKERVIKSGIECCTTRDCSSTQYCTSDYKCELVPQAVTTTVKESTKSGDGSDYSNGPSGSSGDNNIWIILVVLLIIIVGVYFYYTKYRKQKSSLKKEGLTCEKCGSSIKHTDKFCETCGSQITKTKKTEDKKANVCKTCGSKISHEDKFCESCGTKLK